VVTTPTTEPPVDAEASAEATTDLYIDGERVGTTDRLDVRDPARPTDRVGYAAAATRDQALAAVDAARRAFPAWAARSAPERADMVLASLASLVDHHEADAEILTRENGKVRMESKIDLWVFQARFQLACGLGEAVDQTTTLEGPPYRTEVRHRPLGVVTIIVPFNWPLAILAASLPYALVAGNTVVVKPPPSAPLATTRVVRRVAEALPPGVVNVVTGRDSDVGAALVRNADVAKVCFTGSPAGGRRIMEMASGTLTRVALELGGNDPAVILDDALLDEAALDRLFHGIFDSTGQICMAAKRIYVHRSRYDEVVDGLSAILERTVLGHGLDESTTMGPLHTRRQRDFVVQLLDEARASGAEVREFGELPDRTGRRQLPAAEPGARSRSGAAGGDRGAVRPHRADHPVRRCGGCDRRGQRHLGRAVLIGLDVESATRRRRGRPAVQRVHLGERPRCGVPRRAGTLRGMA
jgi:acyl-CoA reductase-like NAD-dependent aldehyde dehydrogenase